MNGYRYERGVNASWPTRNDDGTQGTYTQYIYLLRNPQGKIINTFWLEQSVKHWCNDLNSQEPSYHKHYEEPRA